MDSGFSDGVSTPPASCEEDNSQESFAGKFSSEENEDDSIDEASTIA
jgi:hypothetical protein